MPLHAHRQAEVDYVVSGEARIHAGDAVADVAAGVCIYHAPGAAHAVEALGAAPLRYVRTFACERLAPPPERVPQPAPGAPAPWIGRPDSVAWRAVEPSKGLQIRVKRLVDRGVEVMAGVCEFDPGVHYTRHFHDQPEIYVVLAGSGVVYKGDEEVEVGPGAALYLTSREVHGLDSLGDEPLSLYWVYGCETAGDRINWTPVEPVYERARPRAARGR